MRHKNNKSAILNDFQLERKNQADEENKKIQMIKEQIRRQQIQLQEKDDQLRKHEEELYRQIQLERKFNTQPLKSTQLLIHQREYESQKIIKDQERQNRKIDSHQLEYPKSIAYIKFEKEQELIKDKQFEYRRNIVNRKKKQIKYSQIVQSMLIRPVAKSSYDKNQKQSVPSKSQHISQNQEEEDTFTLKPIDKYLIRKLEKILNIQSDRNLVSQSPNQTSEANTQKTNQKSQLKLEPIVKSRDNSPQKQFIKKARYRDMISNHKPIPQFEINEWKTIMDDKSLSGPDKVSLTLDKIKQLNERTKKLEQQINGTSDIEKEGQVNDMLINQVQARLAILVNSGKE